MALQFSENQYPKQTIPKATQMTQEERQNYGERSHAPAHYDREFSRNTKRASYGLKALNTT